MSQLCNSFVLKDNGKQGFSDLQWGHREHTSISSLKVMESFVFTKHGAMMFGQKCPLQIKLYLCLSLDDAGIIY